MMATKDKLKTVLIIDGNHTLHRGYHSMQHMKFNGKGTGAIFGFLQILVAGIGNVKPSKIFACFDDGRNKERLKILPTYKEREPKIDFDYEDFINQKNVVMRMMKHLGIPTLMAPGQEADDFIYTLVKKYYAKGYKIIILSGDKDFRQLVCDRVWIIDNNKGMINPLNFKKNFIIEPNQYADYLALDGDTSDKIPGVPGIGPKTAIAMLLKHGSVTAYLGNGANAKDSKYKQIAEVYGRNIKLINLALFDHLFGPQELVFFKGLKKPKQRLDRWNVLCAKYGINKFRKHEFINKIP